MHYYHYSHSMPQIKVLSICTKHSFTLNVGVFLYKKNLHFIFFHNSFDPTAPSIIRDTNTTFLKIFNYYYY